MGGGRTAWGPDLGYRAFEEIQVQSVDGPWDIAGCCRAHTPGPFPAASLSAHTSGTRTLVVHVPKETIGGTCHPPHPWCWLRVSLPKWAWRTPTVRPRSQGPLRSPSTAAVPRRQPPWCSCDARSGLGVPLPSEQLCSSGPPPSHHRAALRVPVSDEYSHSPIIRLSTAQRASQPETLLLALCYEDISSLKGKNWHQTLKCHLPAPQATPPVPVSSGNI